MVKTVILFLFLAFWNTGFSQDNLLLNGNFEDINTCTEYNSECGVEAWFYLAELKIQMLTNEEPVLYPYLGNNSLGMFLKWNTRTKFYPLMGTLLPCRLQKDGKYIFKGMIKKIDVDMRIIVKPGVVIGENFYVPNRPFALRMHPDSITQLQYVPKTGYFQFEYSFVATGDEKFLTFGTYVQEDTLQSKKRFIGTPTISLALDNFQLLPDGATETDCSHLIENKESIYNYNYRHKEMDYSLFSRGDLNIVLDTTHINPVSAIPPQPTHVVKTDTLKLSDVLFDFNKAKLKPAALQMLEEFFKSGSIIDSIYVEGHTDSVGTDSRNMALSTQRCESVESWLTKNNIVEERNISIHPFGKTRPVATNKTAQGRALNRRVEMIIFRQEKNK